VTSSETAKPTARKPIKLTTMTTTARTTTTAQLMVSRMATSQMAATKTTETRRMAETMVRMEIPSSSQTPRQPSTKSTQTLTTALPISQGHFSKWTGPSTSSKLSCAKFKQFSKEKI